MSDQNEEHKDQALIPIEEKTVDFYGDEISAALVKVETGQEEVYVPLRPLCEYLGLDWAGQYQRLKRDPVLSKAIISVVVTPTQIGKGQRRRDVLALRLDLLPGWLFGINAVRVKATLKDKIIRYQEECFRVLWRAFQDEAAPFTEYNPVAVEREPNPVLAHIRDQALAQARMSEALARMAEQQMEIEAKALEALDQAYFAHQRLNEFGKFVNRLDVRLGEVEQAVRPGSTITTQEAAAISQTVKALAEFLTTKLGPIESSGRVHYQTIFAELYRRFGVSDYKNIRREQYAAVINFLEDWRISAGGEAQPRQFDMGI